jgi:prevent-host-death family protein
METIGLRELNQNPSQAVARVRAGVTLVVTSRGEPVLRMVPEIEPTSILQKMLASGEVQAPDEQGLPEIVEDLVPEVESLSDLLIADRDRERNR